MPNLREKRNEKAQLWECTMMDFGAEEIEFYTLNYPKTIGADWDVDILNTDGKSIQEVGEKVKAWMEGGRI